MSINFSAGFNDLTDIFHMVTTGKPGDYVAENLDGIEVRETYMEKGDRIVLTEVIETYYVKVLGNLFGFYRSTRNVHQYQLNLDGTGITSFTRPASGAATLRVSGPARNCPSALRAFHVKALDRFAISAGQHD